MKNSVILKIDEKTQYEISFTIRDLARMEREIGRSLTSVMSGGVDALISKMDIAVTIAGLKNGALYRDSSIKPQEVTDKAYDIIQSYCDNGGTVDQINALLLRAINASGLFIPGVKDKAPEEKKKDKQ